MRRKTMKPTPIIAVSILLVVQLLAASTDSVILSRVCHHQQYHHKSNQLPHWCKHFLDVRQHQKPPPMPPAPPEQSDEIDARYGVSKRLVPTGPNPLHN
ncbi:CLAVATA3/ESR (CLE)-related protein 9 [Rhynchospora pubera]|uniref:CLAVATA3/ESR (CLE)-related protein 9 n=1 Tax=Rhynchospora pubera TaxID=906938 RepID=A0AAV8CFH5_9POAL|nr:CLAVATA3/ESR (CLE)-related protein 9 [Rhynchospora pubera]